jgi:carotenoid 1,2-hydratase
VGGVPPAVGAGDIAGAVPGWGQRASGAGGADGGAFRPAGGIGHSAGLRFDAPVASGGYAWWYVDAISDDGEHAITLIAFVGSVFSPWYFAARRGGRTPDPENYCSLNVLLRGPRAARFAMTERKRRAIRRSADTFEIGPSALHWDGERVDFTIREAGAPLPFPIRGRVQVVPQAITGRDFALDRAGRHQWWPIAPSCRVSVAFDAPAMQWSGTGYLDCNWGSAALEQDFARWDWSCARLGGGDSEIVYERWQRNEAEPACLAIQVSGDGAVADVPAPPRVRLPDTAWRLARYTRAETIRSVRTLDDTPFYARSVLGKTVLGREVTAMHESLSLDRFKSGWMQLMLPFRMRRW